MNQKKQIYEIPAVEMTWTRMDSVLCASTTGVVEDYGTTEDFKW